MKAEGSEYNFPVRMSLESCLDVHPQLFRDGDVLHQTWNMEAFTLGRRVQGPPTLFELDWIICPCCGWGRGPRSPRSLTRLRFERK